MYDVSGIMGGTKGVWKKRELYISETSELT
jgi:hypothetical protein